MQVILIRHGETEWNVNKRFQGRGDSNLTKKGVETAQNIANELKNKKISTIYSSTLGRALETAKIISKKINVKVTPAKELIEYHYGVAEALTREEVEQKHPRIMTEREKDKFHFRMPEGESYADVEDRVKPFIKKIKTKHQNQSMLIVGHEMVNRIILKQLLNLTPTETEKIIQPNDCIYFIDYSQKPGVKHLRMNEGKVGKGVLEKN